MEGTAYCLKLFEVEDDVDGRPGSTSHLLRVEVLKTHILRHLYLLDREETPVFFSHGRSAMCFVVSSFVFRLTLEAPTFQP